MARHNSLRTLGTWALVGYLAAVGALAGFASWVLVWLAHLIFQIPEPTFLALILAIPRGAIFGIIFALILRWYFKRSQGG